VLKTVSVRVKNRTISDVETLLWSLTSPNGTVVRLKSKRELRITDVPSEVDRMVQIARAVDKSSVPDQSIWIFTHMTSRSSETASSLNELFMKERPPGVTLSKVIPVDSKRVLVVVGNRAAGHWILQRRPKGCTGPPLGPDFEPVELPIGPPPGAH
jgi:type II secretory pathway component GspD/PulD (secretin)